MTDLTVITHADNCWSWGPKHYKCAVREIRAKRAEVAAWRELSDRMEAVLDQLQAENERLREDAERWRALRELDGGEIYALLGDCDGIHPEQADAAIDRARGKEVQS